MAIELGGVLAGLFPPAVAVAELREPGEVESLLAEEAREVGRMVPSRAAEFAAGRACARRALGLLGIFDFPIGVAADRQPVWPATIVGSITHTTGFCAAVVASRVQISAIGLDSELTGAPAPDLWPTLCVEEELGWLLTLPVAQRAAAATLLFSAKEAFYKCQYPWSAEWLDFKDVSVKPVAWGTAGEFTITATRRLRIEQLWPFPLRGRYLFHERFVSTGVALAALDGTSLRRPSPLYY